MEQSREALKTAHESLTKAMAEFTKLVLASDTGRTFSPDDLKSVSVHTLENGRIQVIRKDHWCYVYDNQQQVCRLCTAEEDQGAWTTYPPP